MSCGICSSAYEPHPYWPASERTFSGQAPLKVWSRLRDLGQSEPRAASGIRADIMTQPNAGLAKRHDQAVGGLSCRIDQMRGPAA